MTLSAATLSYAEPIGKRLREAWVVLLGRIDEAAPAEWFGHFTFPDAIHPEKADKTWRRFSRLLNEEIYGRRYKEHGEGLWSARASEYQQRGVLHYHAIMGGGVRTLHRLQSMRLWESLGGGISRIQPYDRNRGALRYVVKYAVKGGEIDLFIPPDLERLLRGGLLQQTLRRA